MLDRSPTRSVCYQHLFRLLGPVVGKHGLFIFTKYRILMQTYTISGFVTIPYVINIDVENDDVNMDINDEFVKDNLATSLKQTITKEDTIHHILDLQVMDIQKISVEEEKINTLVNDELTSTTSSV